MNALVALAAGYLCGSVPFAYLAGKLLKGIDLRTVGSGNLGATNVLRTLGWRAGVVVLLLDAAKGALPVWLLPRITHDHDPVGLGLTIGLAAILGHAKPLFLRGRGGGKGVATAAGVFGALAPGALAICLMVFGAVVAASRVVSLASVAAAAVLPLAVAVTGQLRSPIFPTAIGVAGFVIWRHRANLGRIVRGEEPRVTLKGGTP